MRSSWCARGRCPRGRSAWWLSTNTRIAGKSVIIPTQAIRIAMPAMKPSSWMPRKSVSISTKNVPAAVSAPASMPGPVRAAVCSRASRRFRPRKISSS